MPANTQSPPEPAAAYRSRLTALLLVCGDQLFPPRLLSATHFSAERRSPRWCWSRIAALCARRPLHQQKLTLGPGRLAAPGRGFRRKRAMRDLSFTAKREERSLAAGARRKSTEPAAAKVPARVLRSAQPRHRPAGSREACDQVPDSVWEPTTLADVPHRPANLRSSGRQTPPTADGSLLSRSASSASRVLLSEDGESPGRSMELRRGQPQSAASGPRRCRTLPPPKPRRPYRVTFARRGCRIAFSEPPWQGGGTLVAHGASPVPCAGYDASSSERLLHFGTYEDAITPAQSRRSFIRCSRRSSTSGC